MTTLRTIPFGRPWITAADQQAVLAVLQSPLLTHGPQGQQFEADFAKFLGEDCYCVTVSSCMAALHLAYLQMGIGPGDEVIVPAQTHTATAHAVELVGARPVFVDCESCTGNIDCDKVASFITPRSKALSIVHFLGIPCAMDEILSVAEHHRLKVVEDCALAVGARYQGRHVGLFGDAGCFDFRAKVLTERGNVPIGQVRVGDKVLTHRGRHRTVTQIFRRQYEGYWYRVSLRGMRSTAVWHNRVLCATEEHPVLVNRNGNKKWIPVKELERSDWIYIRASRCEICSSKIPFFWKLCEYHNPAEQPAVKDKISKSMDRGIKPQTYRSKHYYEDVLPTAERLKAEGYRVIPIGVAVPDIIAIKEDKVIAYEVENKIPRKRKLSKYTDELRRYYDDIIWVAPEKKRAAYKSKHPYIADTELDLVAVPIESIKKIWKKDRPVYNLEVEEDHSYFVANVSVHNCFSFYPVKHITAGEGGMVVTRNPEVAEKVSRLRAFGVDRSHSERAKVGQYDVLTLGLNYRMSELQAALGRSQLSRIKEILEHRRNNFTQLKNLLAPLDNVVILDTADTAAISSHYCLSVLLTGHLAQHRDDLVEKLKQAGVGTSVYYPQPVPRMTYYRQKYGYRAEAYANAAAISDHSIALPVGPHLVPGDIEYIAARFRQAVQEIRS
jgi:dTDP-4-amino-4,6-dideoxygalactose transaminase